MMKNNKNNNAFFFFLKSNNSLIPSIIQISVYIGKNNLWPNLIYKKNLNIFKLFSGNFENRKPKIKTQIRNFRSR